MPTYAPVPSSFTSLSHQGQALYLYRHILREGAKFFDERTSHWVISRAQEVFRKNSAQTDDIRIHRYMSDARKALRTLERANQMDLKATKRLLRLSHGLQGKERQKLLQPYVDSARMSTLSPEKLSIAIVSSLSSPPPNIVTATAGDSSRTVWASQLSTAFQQSIAANQPLHGRNPRTVPPILSPVLVSMLTNATGKSPEPVLPVPLFKPLHGKREANLRWRFFSKQVKRLQPPLPNEILEEIECKSRIGLKRLSQDSSGSCDVTAGIASSGPGVGVSNAKGWVEWEQHIIETIKAWNRNGKQQRESRWENGRFHPSIGGKPAKSNTMSLRLYRRIWQLMLNSIPVLNVHETSAKSGKGKEQKPMNPSSMPHFSMSRSPQALWERRSISLKVQAEVNSFDRIGMTDAPQTAQSSHRSKASG